MTSIRDERGYNQGWAPSHATEERTRRRCAYMLGEMRNEPAERVLEIGCGTGEIAFRIACATSKDIVAVDVSRLFIEQAARRFQRPNLSYRCMDFRNPGDLEGERFDYVIGDGILHHLYPVLDDALGRIRELLKPGGRVVFLEPNLSNPYCYMIFTYGFLRRRARLDPDEMAFTRRFGEAALARTGYRNIRIEHRDFLLPGIPDVLIRPSIVAGAVMERVPFVRALAQSLFITASV